MGSLTAGDSSSWRSWDLPGSSEVQDRADPVAVVDLDDLLLAEGHRDFRPLGFDEDGPRMHTVHDGGVVTSSGYSILDWEQCQPREDPELINGFLGAVRIILD